MKTATYDRLVATYGLDIAAQALHIIIQAHEAKRLRDILAHHLYDFNETTLQETLNNLSERIKLNRVRLKYALFKRARNVQESSPSPRSPQPSAV